MPRYIFLHRMNSVIPHMPSVRDACRVSAGDTACSESHFRHSGLGVMSSKPLFGSSIHRGLSLHALYSESQVLKAFQVASF